MLRLQTLWLVPAVLALIAFEPSAAPANAQTYSFNGVNYDLLNNASFLTETPPRTQVVVAGTSTDAPYGLTNLSGLVYGQFDTSDGSGTFNTDPTALGLQGFPLGSIVLAESGGDQLFGSETASGKVDFETLAVTNAGSITITGGTGKYQGITGTLSFSELGQRDPNPALPYKGRITLSGSLQKVPEPSSETALVAMGTIGASVLLRRRYLKSTVG